MSRVTHPRTPQDPPGPVEGQHRHPDERRDLGEHLVDPGVGDQQVQKVVLHGHRAAQPVQVRGRERVVDVGEDGPRQDPHGDLDDGHPQLPGSRRELGRNAFEVVPHRDGQGRGVDGGQAIQQPEAGLSVGAEPPAGDDQDALAGQVGHGVCGIGEMDAFHGSAEARLAGRHLQPETGVLHQFAHRQDAVGASASFHRAPSPCLPPPDSGPRAGGRQDGVHMYTFTPKSVRPGAILTLRARVQYLCSQR